MTMNQAVTAVGFVSTTDAERAKAFYGEVLGLPITADAFATIAQVGDASLRITTLPDFKASDAPAFGFKVADLDGQVARLIEKGVSLERFAFLGDDQDAQGIWTGPDGSRLAWFKDPDGNLLVMQG